MRQTYIVIGFLPRIGRVFLGMFLGNVMNNGVLHESTKDEHEARDKVRVNGPDVRDMGKTLFVSDQETRHCKYCDYAEGDPSGR